MVGNQQLRNTVEGGARIRAKHYLHLEDNLAVHQAFNFQAIFPVHRGSPVPGQAEPRFERHTRFWKAAAPTTINGNCLKLSFGIVFKKSKKYEKQGAYGYVSQAFPRHVHTFSSGWHCP